ncbi:hypothetical protein HHI36_010892 [Cryptolaemus montrouzieri]|uniref:Uncharacterized protein n=1 Tax=Cryptolaemus montrouzieri TaxID=559131 RepID=A0ABD2MK15_9CUCU
MKKGNYLDKLINVKLIHVILQHKTGIVFDVGHLGIIKEIALKFFNKMKGVIHRDGYQRGQYNNNYSRGRGFNRGRGRCQSINTFNGLRSNYVENQNPEIRENQDDDNKVNSEREVNFSDKDNVCFMGQ